MSASLMMLVCLASGSIFDKKSITASLAFPIGSTVRFSCGPLADDTRSAILTLFRMLAI
jgi:hypothetical protein